MGGFVNIKTFTHPAGEGKKVKGMEVSVAFDVYSNEHRIADSHYQIFPSEKAAYSNVVSDATTWKTKNAEMFTPTEIGG